ncbi:hypothetical protein Pelo_4467 [Pelomyxa schiedti]|nr:hypothetical protein Pelo_4467 [Pelomyxa schiedti]
MWTGTAQLVVPGVLIGDANVGESPDKLGALGITHVVRVHTCPAPAAVAAALARRGSSGASGGGDRVYHCRVLDDSCDRLAPHMRPVAEWMANAIGENPANKVLVHCGSGLSRSATVVIGYLMLKHGMSFRAALDTVRTARPVIDPDLIFLSELCSLERELLGINTITPQQFPAIRLLSCLSGMSSKVYTLEIVHSAITKCNGDPQAAFDLLL